MSLGARAETVEVTGSIKFDLTIDPQLLQRASQLRGQWQALERPVWIAASTHDGEDEVVLAAHRQLAGELSRARLLILVPRHPERFSAVFELCQPAGLCHGAALQCRGGQCRYYRIELGEIETRLREHPGGREATVVAREDQTGQKRLVAYYVAAGPEVTPLGLREHVARLLPEYMHPNAWVPLEKLPQTTNGKLDRAALPVPSYSPEGADALRSPARAKRRELAEIWKRLLKVDRISRHSNFLEIGGHSLLAVRVVLQIQQSFGIELSVSELFEHCTLSGLSDLVVTRRLALFDAVDLELFHGRAHRRDGSQDAHGRESH